MDKLDKNNIEDILPLTPLQEGILFHYLKESEDDLYFEQLTLELSGEINVNIFDSAWNLVIETNEMLRTVFRWERLEKAMQIILKEHQFKVAFHDLSKSESSRKRAALADIKNKDRLAAFDLHQVPFRVILIKMEEKKFRMVISNHHILYDGWSNGIILKEFFRAYHELSKGKPSLTLPKKSKPPFKKFINWVQARDRNKQEQFWRGYLEDFDTPTVLNIKRSRVGNKGKEVRSYSFFLEGNLKKKLDVILAISRVTLASVLYCSWGILLQKYCNSDDVVFGTTVAGRSAAIKGIEKMVGLFINTLPLRVRVYPHEKIGAVVFRIDRLLQERADFERTPLVDIKSSTSMENHESLFDTIVALENYPLEHHLLPGDGMLAVNSYSIIERTNYDLAVGVIAFDDIKITITYHRQLFEDETIYHLGRHFKEVVQKIVNNPEEEIFQLEILSGEEKYRLLYVFNDTNLEFPEDKTIHQLFAGQVERTPARIALLSPEVSIRDSGKSSLQGFSLQITYRELKDRACHLANQLIEKGIQPDTIVGIMVERSVEMIMGIFGILAAGGAYLPILPGYPAKRIEYMLSDCDAALLLTVSDLSPEINFGDKNIIFSHKTKGVSTPQLPSLHPSRSRDLAYVIYTSGSTGKPKGVTLQHRSVINRLSWMQGAYPLEGSDIILQKTAITFDVSVWELFWWSFCGAKLVLLEPGGEKDPAAILQTVARHRVTTIHFVPSMLNVFLDYLDNRVPASGLKPLKQVFASGEVLTAHQVSRFNCLSNKSNRPRLINLYGPTEATVDVSYFNCPPGECYDRIPIGRPIDNLQLYIVDKHNRLQPLWVSGELCIAGIGLARGYLNRPELTAEKFKRVAIDHSTLVIDDPVKNSEGFSGSSTDERLYKTGDLARWLADGNIEFLGRRDQQVKIRGIRIELEEIESQILQCEDIREVVLEAREDEVGDRYLCAYLVPKIPGSWTLSQTTHLKDYLLNFLPAYMIPSFFVLLERVPLTSSGKVDRNGLPAPGISTRGAIIAPRNEIEQKLADIWIEVLNRDMPIGIDENFFTSGGHSLKAVLLASRIHQVFDVKLSLTEIFKKSTLRQLAEVIRDMDKEHHASINITETKEYYRLSSAQKRIYILQQMEPESTAFNISQVISLEGELNPVEFKKVFQALMARHESFRTSFKLLKGKPVQKISPLYLFDVEYIIAKRGNNNEFGQPHPDGLLQIPGIGHIVNRFLQPFDLNQAPLFRVGFIKVAENHHILMTDMHHIISDGVSEGILIADLVELYKGEELRPLKLQYKDYSDWQNRLLNSGEIKKQEEYWLDRFKGDIPVLEIPTDFPRKSFQSYEARDHMFIVDGKLKKAVQGLAAQYGATLYMTLLALFSILLSKYTDQSDIIIGSPTAGRVHADLDNVVGMFVNVLLMRTFPTPENTFAGFLHEVKTITLEAFENQDFQFDDLVEHLRPGLNRDTDRNPLYNVIFAVLNMEKYELQLPGVQLVSLLKEKMTAKTELRLRALETDKRIEFKITYVTALFKENTIEEMADHYVEILKQVIKNNKIKIKDIKIPCRMTTLKPIALRSIESEFNL